MSTYSYSKAHLKMGKNVPIFLIAITLIEFTLCHDFTMPDMEHGKYCDTVHTVPLCPFMINNNYSTNKPFQNKLNHSSYLEAYNNLLEHAILFQDPECKEKIELFLCSLYIPYCTKEVPSKPIMFPCKELCHEAKPVCLPVMEKLKKVWPAEWDCEHFESFRNDPLCFNKNDNSTSVKPKNEPKFVFESPIKDEEKCSPDLFDCKIPDHLICIEHKFVCDGKNDCTTSNLTDGNVGLDEVLCPESISNCTENQIYCDSKCISKSSICDGKVDCLSATDELCSQTNDNNPIYWRGIVIYLSVASFCVIILITKHSFTCLKSKPQNEKDLMNINQEIQSPTQVEVQNHPHYSQNSFYEGSDYYRVLGGKYSGASTPYEPYDVSTASCLSLSLVDPIPNFNTSHSMKLYGAEAPEPRHGGSEVHPSRLGGTEAPPPSPASSPSFYPVYANVIEDEVPTSREDAKYSHNTWSH